MSGVRSNPQPTTFTVKELQLLTATAY